MKFGRCLKSWKCSIVLVMAAAGAWMWTTESAQAAPRPGVCRGRPLPAGQTRKLRNLQLECTSNSDHYIRGFVPFNMETWNHLEQLRDREGMQRLRQQEALIQWSGRIPYSTVETWEWTEWTFGPDPSCGYDREVTRDRDGNETVTETMRSCFHDEDRYEERFCSEEVIRYEASFERPSIREWNPSSPGYYDIIPNKYDLLPGEIEDVQIFSNGSRSTRIAPTFEVGNAWNTYNARFQIAQTSSPTAICATDQTLDLKVSLVTAGRLSNKRTPNTFRVPLDKEGNPIEVLTWLQNMTGTGRTVPDTIRLTDQSAAIITAMARQTRKFDQERFVAKSETGQGGNNDEAKTESYRQQSGFWKNTQIRVKLYESVVGRDHRMTQNLYTDGASVAKGDQYRVALNGASFSDQMYRMSGGVPSQTFWGALGWAPVPSNVYYFEISMFQQGVPFYKQTAWTEDGYFSEPLNVEFLSDANVDERSLYQKYLDFKRHWFW